MQKSNSTYALEVLAISYLAIMMFFISIWVSAILVFVLAFLHLQAWGIKLRQRTKILDIASRNEATVDALQRIGRCGFTAAEVNSVLFNSQHPRFIGDVSCKNNARSAYIRCAINPFTIY
ncbi:MAG: DUF6464 family protein [Nostoc sp.]|uniref:DUF6464 family protein n=1 Tax=Nostoc sp. TaxID=1180 RepID=UPI002FF7067E